MLSSILLMVVKFIMESIFGLLKETVLSPVKITATETKVNIPPYYDRIGAARLVDNFDKLQNRA